MENPPYPAMTVKQIIKELVSRSEGVKFNSNIDETQLTKLLQHHAQYYDQIKINGKKHRPWILVKGKKLDNKEIRESVKQCGI